MAYYSIFNTLMGIGRKTFAASILIGFASLTSCVYHYAPSSVNYNGAAYRNGWYCYGEKGTKDLHVCEILPTEEEPLFTKNRYEFWPADGFALDFLYVEFDEAAMAISAFHTS